MWRSTKHSENKFHFCEHVQPSILSLYADKMTEIIENNFFKPLNKWDLTMHCQLITGW